MNFNTDKNSIPLKNKIKRSLIRIKTSLVKDINYKLYFINKSYRRTNESFHVF